MHASGSTVQWDKQPVTRLRCIQSASWPRPKHNPIIQCGRQNGWCQGTSSLPRGHTLCPRSISRRAIVGPGTVAALGASLALATGLAAAVGVAAAATAAGNTAGDPRKLVSTGMTKFRRNDVEGAAADFDAAWQQASALRPYLWQRGLAAYYLGRYDEGAAQFRSDVAVNPNDTEEAIWTFICEARTMGPEAARKQFLQVGRDSRPVMRAAYECFKTGSGPEQIRAAMSNDGGHSTFYGLLYIGLWHEAHGGLQEPAAQAAMEAAVATPYARFSGDYMADLARVHCARRGWNTQPQSGWPGNTRAATEPNTA